MYTTCMFCKKPLGTNEVVERFPVGRRLAFDAEKGRLWVVCPKCQRWNLTPLEERWEAVEDCERLFRETPMRVSSENVGLARHREGLDLVRIGWPSRGEFAAWRYGERFRRRYRAAALGTVGAVGVGIALNPLLVAVPAGVILTGTWAALAWSRLRPVAKVRVGAQPSDGGAVAPENVATFRLRALRSVRLLPDGDEPGFKVEVLRGVGRAEFVGEHARRVAAALVPYLNRWGGSQASVQRAVHEIESVGHPGRFVAHVAKLGYRDWKGRSGYMRSVPDTTRLALEMALHEEQERRALEGELWILEQAWREAEEIAAIADSLLLPARTEAFFDRHGQGA